jgi:hypothetical protein
MSWLQPQSAMGACRAGSIDPMAALGSPEALEAAILGQLLMPYLSKGHDCACANLQLPTTSASNAPTCSTPSASGASLKDTLAKGGHVKVVLDGLPAGEADPTTASCQDAKYGTLERGGKYDLSYDPSSKSFSTYGPNLSAGRDLTAQDEQKNGGAWKLTYDNNGDPSQGTFNMWGHSFKFNDCGEVLDENGKVVGHMTAA